MFTCQTCMAHITSLAHIFGALQQLNFSTYMSTQTDDFTTNFIQLIVFLTLNFICISALLKFVYSHHDIKLDSSVALLKNLEACSTVILIMYLLKINLITILLLFNTVVILPYHTSVKPWFHFSMAFYTSSTFYTLGIHFITSSASFHAGSNGIHFFLSAFP